MSHKNISKYISSTVFKRFGSNIVSYLPMYLNYWLNDLWYIYIYIGIFFYNGEIVLFVREFWWFDI